MALGNIEPVARSSPTASRLLAGIDVLPQAMTRPTDLLLLSRHLQERSKRGEAETTCARRSNFTRATACANYFGYSWIDQGINLDKHE